MKQICQNCHFMSKESRNETGVVHILSVSSKEREEAKSGNIDFVGSHYSLNCYHGVWDEGVAPGKENRLRNINGTNRKRKCFFWPHNPEMLFKAAVELQKREQENEQMKRSNLYTRIGLWIAAIGLFLGVIVFLVKE
jgi:hypothetical protein